MSCLSRCPHFRLSCLSRCPHFRLSCLSRCPHFRLSRIHVCETHFLCTYSLQCVPAGTLPLMSPTTPQSQCFQAPQEFDDPLQMVEWLILLESKLQPEKLIVGDFLHVRKALRDVQVRCDEYCVITHCSWWNTCLT